MTGESPINEKNQNSMTMKANSVDQVNVNHQSNMTLCAESVITQSDIKFLYSSEETASEVSSENIEGEQ